MVPGPHDAVAPDEPDYVLAHVTDALARAEDTHLLGVAVGTRGHRLWLAGPVTSESARRAVLAVAAGAAPGWELIDDLEVRGVTDLGVGEELL